MPPAFAWVFPAAIETDHRLIDSNCLDRYRTDIKLNFPILDSPLN